jgi:chromosome partitioning protein
MAAKVISVINYKGGVGKTVSTYNIGFGLSFLNDCKVLLIDLDPQCSLSTVCLNALTKTLKKNIDLTNLKAENTINSVIKDYLSVGDRDPKIDLKRLISNLLYTRHNGTIFKNVDFIPATMYDSINGKAEKGLDDLEIDIIRNYATKISQIDLITLFARFFIDTKINEMYDFILFDCPPANNIITQNALAVSDYYIIPTIMDKLSAGGIGHLKNLIEKTIFEDLYQNNQRIIDRCDVKSPYAFLRKSPELIGIFETARKTQVKYNQRYLVKERFGDLLFNNIIYHHKPTADGTSEGISCFTLNINSNKPEYSPHVNYGNLVLEILRRIGIPKKNNGVEVNSWL